MLIATRCATRPSSRIAAGASSMKATTSCASARSKLSSANGSSSAGASCTSSCGKRERNARANSGDGSTATTLAPRRRAHAVNAPVPAPTSSTCCPSPTPANSAKSGASRTEYRPMKSSYDSSSVWKTPLTGQFKHPARPAMLASHLANRRHRRRHPDNGRLRAALQPATPSERSVPGTGGTRYLGCEARRGGPEK